MRSLHLQHNDTGQLAKIIGSRLIIVRPVIEGFLMPSKRTTHYIFEIHVIEHIDEDYINNLCQTNVSLGKKEWEQKLNTLIQNLIA